MGLLCRAIIEIDIRQWPKFGRAGRNEFSGNVTAMSFHTLCLIFETAPYLLHLMVLNRR
jgi:hypothetical protein